MIANLDCHTSRLQVSVERVIPIAVIDDDVVAVSFTERHLSLVWHDLRYLIRKPVDSLEHRPVPPDAPQADAILNDLMEAAEWILRSSSR
jgi:hypothetical protein